MLAVGFFIGMFVVGVKDFLLLGYQWWMMVVHWSLSMRKHRAVLSSLC